MPKGKTLSEHQVGEIVAHLANGRSYREIARLIGCSTTAVHNAARDPSAYGGVREIELLITYISPHSMQKTKYYACSGIAHHL